MNLKQLSFLLYMMVSTASVFGQGKGLNLIYIGDSITAGAGIGSVLDYPTIVAIDELQKAGIYPLRSSNQGHSGYTTLDFLPGSNAFIELENAANEYKGAHETLLFSIMLGTNDSAIRGPHGSPVAVADYYKNLHTIIDRLLKDYPGCKVLVHHPLWYSPNTYNGAMYLREGLNRLQSYFPQIDKLIADYALKNKGRVFLGDTEAFDFFKAHYLTTFQAEQGNQGTFYLHPNEAGAKALGGFWAKAILKVVQ